jgi:KaiC/GvpD/RAD55 family RecA-like ATPase
MSRDGQKQLHVWVSERLKNRLENVRDATGSNFTEIVTEALRIHFDKLEKNLDFEWTGENRLNLVRLEAKLDELRELVDDIGREADQVEPDAGGRVELETSETSSADSAERDVDEEVARSKRIVRRKNR